MNDRIKNIIFDFDGVFTDNKVIVSENGKESVVCNRTDGLAINYLKKFGYNLLIITSETNKVAFFRAKKLNIKIYDSVLKKENLINKLHKLKKINLNNTLYIGNDLNDYSAMKLCKYSCCPLDSHPSIKKISNMILKKNGGQGIVMEVIEKFLKIKVNKLLKG